MLGLRHVPLAYAGSGWFRPRCSSRARVWAFPPFTGERKRSQTLSFKGGNTSWLTKNPSLKSAPAASRLRFGGTKPEGRTRHNVTFSSLYKDGGQWKTTQSFGSNDLLVLAKVADRAHSRISRLQQEDEPQAAV